MSWQTQWGIVRREQQFWASQQWNGSLRKSQGWVEEKNSLFISSPVRRVQVSFEGAWAVGGKTLSAVECSLCAGAHLSRHRVVSAQTLPGPLRTAPYPIAHSIWNRDTLSFAFKGFLKVQPPVKPGSEFIIIKAALSGRKGLFRTVLFGVTRNALGNLFLMAKNSVSLLVCMVHIVSLLTNTVQLLHPPKWWLTHRGLGSYHLFIV